MNLWLGGALALLLVLVPCGWIFMHGSIGDCFVAVQFATGTSVLALTLIAIGLHRSSFLDIGLTLSLLSYPASLLFAHFLERWL